MQRSQRPYKDLVLSVSPETLLHLGCQYGGLAQSLLTSGLYGAWDL